LRGRGLPPSAHPYGSVPVRRGRTRGRTSPKSREARLLLPHPCLPFRVGVHVRAVVVEEVALNVGLARLVEKGKFIGPKIRVIAFHIGIVPDMARPRRRERQEISAKRAFVSSAIGPKGPPRLPIRP